MPATPLIRFDWAIKYILRDKANFDVLEGFLGAVLQRDIHILQMLESESNQAEETDKFNRVDLLAETQEGEKIIIEVQNEREVHYLERMLYGTSKLIVENLHLGESYKHIKKVYSISILYFTFNTTQNDYVYYGTTEFRGLHNHELLTLPKHKHDTLPPVKIAHRYPEYYLIEVEKFQDVIASDLDEWIYMLKHEAIRDDFKAKHIDKAKAKLDYLKLPPDQRKRYQRYLENLGREKGMVEGAWIDGKQVGREEGEKIGLEKGEKIGLEKGREEGEKTALLRTAKNLKEAGMEVSEIAKATGLSEAEIAGL